MSGTLSTQFQAYLRQRHPQRSGEPAGDTQLALWDRFGLSAEAFAEEAVQFTGLDRASLRELMAAPPAVSEFSDRFLREVLGYPYRSSEGSANFAMADPTDQAVRRAAELVLGPDIIFKVASHEDIAVVLDQRLAAGEEADISPVQDLRDDDIESLRDLASGAPVVRAVNDLIEKAVEMRASDIHIEPFSTGLVVRLRVDGLLRPIAAPAGVLPQAVISRIKIVAGLNIAERRLPQDGAARIRAGRAEIDVRVAIMPTQHGETAVLRILPKDRSQLVASRLGLSQRDDAALRRLIALPHGMIVITGPTGSGKTTTLATILSMLNTPERKILTIEDPVEYEIPGINQSQIKPAIGLTFATALRSFVRQDPDVIMVGEIRDNETAHVAVHAALTGHLVLTTLHTETAAAAVPRLLDLGVEGYLLRSTLRAVIAQRLVRQLCDHCKIAKPLDEETCRNDPRFGHLGLAAGDVTWHPVGCERCGQSGYRGRVGVFEMLELTSSLRELIADSADGLAIDRLAMREGMTTMLDDGVAKCRAGVTSTSELFRVLVAR
ncbi:MULTISPECIES: GspE/PulE family protein [Bradyrhizobium]|jgi:general secretion pathway protein E|uniref:Type II/IV secretion system protein n=4 Tax=Bradyrhizobium TaxID=374 RepID=A0ABS5GF26_9BRAD|nr:MULTISPECIES: GspE/PulE family protein [Bradyrhizobium]MBR1139780.1 type II/IV secretion system protein [Bradyrhizobium denitrificans]MDU0956716.1 GspE/PulE family protein [Bradyrhizobium sp.]MDU1493893.1 GspE/PulE family protein [Bradyrhizobium sp.]MDU1547558.1 GspE/PulE family protein [Bradyrhizobium sp.]MDU1807121.1 GspE/PulE family protein [Bradyrhizobium sp.]